MKLSPRIAVWIASVLSILTPSMVMPDPTDVLTVVVLIGSWFYGRRVIARIPYGRVAWAIRRGAREPFRDAIACGADPAAVRALTTATGSGDSAAIEVSLDVLRGRTQRAR